MSLRNQLREAEEHTDRLKRTTSRRVEDLRAQLQDKDKIIESLEYQVDNTRKELQHLSHELTNARADRDTQASSNAQILKQIS